MNLLRRAGILALLAALLCAPLVARAQSGPPPPVPPILDENRFQSYTLVSPTPSVDVSFPIFGDCTDLVVALNGVSLVLNTDFTCASESGGSDLAILPLPITDMVVTFSSTPTTNLPNGYPSSGTLTITGAWHPRDLVQPTAPGINRREFNQDVSTLIAAQREFYYFENTYFQSIVSNLPLNVGLSVILNGIPTGIFYDNNGILGIETLVPVSQLPLGTSVNNPGTGVLESLLPPHTPTLSGNAYAMTVSDLFKETRFSNGGVPFAVTLPPSTTQGLVNGSRVVTNNTDTTATMTVAAGSGTQVNGVSSLNVSAQRSVAWIYDTSTTPPTWRSTYNGINGLLASNNLNDLASTSTARSNLGLGTAATQNTGTSGADVPLLNGANSWSGVQTYNTGDLVINGASATAGLATVTSGGVVSSEAAATVAQGGTGGTSASGTLLDNITGFAGTGLIDRTGPGAYSFTAPGTSVLAALGNAINGASGLPTLDGSITTGDCLQWGPGVQDAGTACGSGSGNVTGPASSNVDDFALYGATTGKSIIDARPGEQFSTSGGSVLFGDGKAHMWPAANQTQSATSPWNAVDMYGNAINCSGTNSQCLNEFLAFVTTNSEPYVVAGLGISYVSQTGTFTDGSETVTGLTNAETVFPEGTRVSGGAITGGTTVASVQSNSEITLSANAIATGSHQINAATSNALYSTVQIYFPPSQEEVGEFDNVTVSVSSAVGSSACVDFDSQMGFRFAWKGGLNCNGTGGGIEFDATGDVPYDGVVGILDSNIYIGSVTCNASANANIFVSDASIGVFEGNYIHGDELNSNSECNYGLEIKNPGSSNYAVFKNLFEFSDMHLATSAAIQNETSTTDASDVYANTFRGGCSPGETSAVCYNSFSPRNIVDITYDSSQAGGDLTDAMILQSTANYTFYRMIGATASTCLSNSSTGSAGNCD